MGAVDGSGCTGMRMDVLGESGLVNLVTVSRQLPLWRETFREKMW